MTPPVAGDRCDVHHRYLSWDEFRDGVCFWCVPWLAPTKQERRPWSMQTGKAATEPSEYDEPEITQTAF